MVCHRSKAERSSKKRRYFREHYDYLRTGLIWEPRGHADMYGAVITPSVDADFDVFFLHNEGYSTMRTRDHCPDKTRG